MYSIRRVIYYLMSCLTLARGVRNWPVLLRLRGHGGNGTQLELRDGTRFVVRSLMDAWIVKETNLDRDYEVHGATIQDGWIIVDVGAGLGDFTVFAARRTPHGQVLAYEPAPDSFVLLEKNLGLNGIKNANVYPYAVSRQNGELSLDVSGGVAVQYRTVGETSAAGGKITVRSVALAEVLAGLPGGVCDLLKVDCEGAEYDMLLHLDEVSLKRIRRICLEYHEFVTSYSHTDLEKHFRSRGWSVRISPSRVRRELGFLYVVAPRVETA